MKTLLKFSKKGEAPVNEDVCDCMGGCAWVIDGATDVFKKEYLKHENEVSWYVQLLNDTVKDILQQQTNDTISAIIKSAVSQLYCSLSDQYLIENLPEYFFPTYAIAAIQCFDGYFSYFILGDCTISYMHNNQLYILEDQRVDVFSQKNREIIKDFLDKHSGDEIPLKLYEETRKMANASEGYPIGSIKSSSIDFGETGEINLSQGDRLVIYSDGFKDYLKAFPEAHKNLFDPILIRDEIKQMYLYLKNEWIYKHEPRPKHIDDCSIILLEA